MLNEYQLRFMGWMLGVLLFYRNRFWRNLKNFNESIPQNIRNSCTGGKRILWLKYTQRFCAMCLCSSAIATQNSYKSVGILSANSLLGALDDNKNQFYLMSNTPALEGLHSSFNFVRQSHLNTRLWENKSKLEPRCVWLGKLGSLQKVWNHISHNSTMNCFTCSHKSNTHCQCQNGCKCTVVVTSQCCFQSLFLSHVNLCFYQSNHEPGRLSLLRILLEHFHLFAHQRCKNRRQHSN